ncbi:unnamed protein product [Caenorhabditis nigoni]
MAVLQRFEQLDILNKPRKHQFPFLKLPKVVLVDCIANLDILEIILFSLLSKRAKTIAKLIRWSPLDICFRFNRTLQICLRLSTDRKWIINYKTNYKTEKYPYYIFEKSDPRVYHYFVRNNNGNPAEDSKQMVEHICEVFRSQICDFHIFDESFIEWIINFQPIIRNVLIPNYVVRSIETLDRILKNLKVTENFHLGSIKTDEKYTEPISSRSVTIKDSFWITLPSIINGTNSIIYLYNSIFTPNDLNTILKEWRMGIKLRNLEFLVINISTMLDWGRFTDEVFKDLNPTESNKNVGRPTKVKIDDEITYTLGEEEEYVNLIRSDGMIGSVFNQYAGNDGEKIFRRFMLQVWRRQP